MQLKQYGIVNIINKCNPIENNNYQSKNSHSEYWVKEFIYSENYFHRRDRPYGQFCVLHENDVNRDYRFRREEVIISEFHYVCGFYV